MGALLVIYIVLLSVTSIAQFLLYRNKSHDKKSIYLVNLAVALFLTAMAFTSLPSNYIVRRGISIGAGIVSLVAIVLIYKDDKFAKSSRLMLTLSITTNLIQLMI